MSITKMIKQSKKNEPYLKIRSLLILRGISNNDLAEALGVTPGATTKVLTGKIESRRIKTAIAEILDIPYKNLWGKEKAE